MKTQLLKRLEEARRRAEQCHEDYLDRLFSKMTTTELRECVEDDISDERFQEIMREAAQR